VREGGPPRAVVALEAAHALGKADQPDAEHARAVRWGRRLWRRLAVGGGRRALRGEHTERVSQPRRRDGRRAAPRAREAVVVLQQQQVVAARHLREQVVRARLACHARDVSPRGVPHEDLSYAEVVDSRVSPTSCERRRKPCGPSAGAIASTSPSRTLLESTLTMISYLRCDETAWKGGAKRTKKQKK
jgi:hypothetical protein